MKHQQMLMVVEIRPRWWVWPYLWTLATLCLMMDTQPDSDKVSSFLARYGFKIAPVTSCKDVAA